MIWSCEKCGLGPIEVNGPVVHQCRGAPMQLPDMSEQILSWLPDDSRKLLGDRIKDLTDALGIPTCGGCEARRQWLNKADAYIRKMWG